MKPPPLRLADLNDIPALERLRELEPDVMMDSPWEDQFACLALVYLDGDIPVAYLYADFAMRVRRVANVDWLCINTLVTHPDHRKRGYGSTLVSNAIGTARANGWGPIVHGICPPNRRKFWRDAGFTVGGEGESWATPLVRSDRERYVMAMGEPTESAFWLVL